MKKTLYVYEVDDGETHWYVATSTSAALREHLKTHSYGSMAEYRSQVPKEERATVTELSDFKRLGIRFENEMGDFDEEIVKQCRTWAKEWGVGFLATTCI